MTALALFQQLYALGVLLTPYPEGTLRYKAPKGVLTPEILDWMRQHKAELHDVVEAFEERAAIAEYGGGLARAEAEQQAWQGVLGMGYAHTALFQQGFRWYLPPDKRQKHARHAVERSVHDVARS